MNGLQLIKASAGSGKTYNLAKLYIEQLLFKRTDHSDGSHTLEVRRDANRHRHILAITFTNKATDEMKRRIVDELYTLAMTPTASNYYKDFAGALRCDGDVTVILQQRASTALSELLLNYNMFNVSTIDAFFQTVLRAFAHELDRDSDYDLQVDAAYVEAVAVNNFLLELGVSGGDKRYRNVVRWVKQCMDNEIAAGKNWKSLYEGNTLRTLCRLLNLELFRAHIDELREYFFGSRRPEADAEPQLQYISAFADAVMARIKPLQALDLSAMVRNILSAHGLKPIHVNGKGALNALLDYDNAKALLTGKKSLGKFFTGEFTTGDVEGLFLKPTSKNLKNDPLPDYDVVSLHRDLTGVRETVFRLRALEALHSRLGVVALIGMLDRSMREVLETSNAVLISDTNELLQHVIGSKDDVPFMYERVGTVLDSYMIDEFQDTSRAQYGNFKPLLDEALSQRESATNLIIGDSKQAIYRFRNAEPALFREELERDMAGRCVTSTLETNYRSRRNVVTFNNTVLRHLLAAFPDDKVLHRTYVGPDRHHPEYVQRVDERKDKDGYGLVTVVTKSAVDPSAMLPAYLLSLHKRLGSWKSIGILTDTNNEGRKAVEAIMKHNDAMHRAGRDDLLIAVASDEAMMLKMSASVNMIIGLLRFVDLTLYDVNEDDAGDNDDDRVAKRDAVARQRRREQRQYGLLREFIDALAREKIFGDGTDNCCDHQRNHENFPVLIGCKAIIDYRAGSICIILDRTGVVIYRASCGRIHIIYKQ